MTAVQWGRKAGLAFVALSTALAVTACGGGESGSKPADGAGAFPRTVDHVMGETTIDKKPQRVVALDHTFVEAAMALETEVVGYTTFFSVDEPLPPYLEKPARTYADEAVSVGLLAEPSLEKIASLKPDLILSAKIRHEALYDELSKIAPTVFTETTGATWKQNVTLTGEALGKEDAAKQVLSSYEDRAEKLGAAIEKERGGQLPTISVVRFMDEPTVRLYQPESYAGVVLSDIGFPRPSEQPKAKDGGIAADVSEENILQLDAEVIFLSRWEDDKGVSKKMEQRFTGNPLWNKLRGERVEVDDATWMLAVGPVGADAILDDVAKHFGVPSAS